MSRTPNDLTHEELLSLVEGLREFMYAGVDDHGNEVWDPDQEVSGSELVAWVSHEMTKLGLVPAPPPPR